MIGWLLLGIFSIISIGFFVTAYTERDKNERLCRICFGAVIGAMILLIVGTIYYKDFLTIPAEYKYLNKTITECKEMISTEKLVMSDIQIHQKIVDLIKERNELLARVEVNNKSPFALFKIKLEK